MAEAKGHLWISQANSDLWAAERLFDAAQPRSYCQAIAKCQQTVEKSVKAVAAALRDRFIFRPDGKVFYKHEVNELASALRRLSTGDDPVNIRAAVSRMLTPHQIAEIKALQMVIPRKPPPGALHARNTEYPFEVLAGEWTAPALNAFTAAEVRRFRQLADHIYSAANRIVSVLQR